MSEFNTLIITKLEKVESDIGDVKVSVTENTADLKHHIKRTDDLQEVVENMKELVNPLYQDFISKKAVENFKKTQRDDLVYKLKLPGYILTALVALAGVLTWLGHK